VRLGTQGRILLRRTNGVAAIDVAQLALTKPNVKAFVEAVSDGLLSEAAQRQTVSAYGSANWTDATWKWRLGILRAWVVGSGQVVSRRGGLGRPD
jgi:hypothetical protein